MKKTNHLPPESVKLPTATKTLLSSHQASLTKKLQFEGECAAIVKGIVQKLQERSPLKYFFVRSLSSLVPKNMIESKNCPSKFEIIEDKLCATNTSILKKQILPNCSWRSLSQAKLRSIKISFLALALLIIVWIIFNASI